MDARPAATQRRQIQSIGHWTTTSASLAPDPSASNPTTTLGLDPAAPVLDSSITIPFPHLDLPHLELLPLLVPQQYYHQAQLLQYNRLVSLGRCGGGSIIVSAPQTKSQSQLQSSLTPPPPQVRSRSSSKASHKDNRLGKYTQVGHGNRSAFASDKGHRLAMTSRNGGTLPLPSSPPQPVSLAATTSRSTSTNQAAPSPSAKMPARQGTSPSGPKSRLSDLSRAQAQAPIQAPFQVQAQAQTQSSSVPSTPHQRARDFSFESSEPSPNTHDDHSPRYAYSETNSTLPSIPPLPPRVSSCQFETAQINSRRRIPYNTGSDRLERVDPAFLKDRLTDAEEQKLSDDISNLYEKLLPTRDVEQKRKRLVDKLERLFNDEWPDRDIRVHLFGSSGNMLCSDDSDVDICITSPWTELESVCMIAQLLANHGMEKIVCISAARVPIVKIWDPELRLACDMNVNNTLALDNTRMVRTYVEVDPRFRPLAMVVKYWTKQRVLNDAAFGGTLSSYTWICMIIAFLQLRHPPVLPALHQCDDMKLKTPGGEKSAFANDLEKLRGFGDRNKASVANLLFQFFRFYAHEFNYDKHVLSVRLGRLATKNQKKWHYAINNQLCVEEPFNTARNLGNTADDFSFRGIHLEIRRAFDLVSETKFEQCCAPYEFPKEEDRVFPRPAQVPRPALIRSSSQQQSGRGGRNNGIRGRGSNNFRGSNSSRNRTASASQAFDPPSVPTVYAQPILATDLAWYYNPFPYQYVQQDLMSISAAYAMQQQQENGLRAFMLHQPYLQAQAPMAHGLPAVAPPQTVEPSGQQLRATQTHAPSQLPPQHQSQHHQQSQYSQQRQQHYMPDRARTQSFDTPPLSAPLQPELYGFYSLFPSQILPASGMTYPASPVTAHSAVGEFRRSMRSASLDPGALPSGSSLRSQSQPASRTPGSTGAVHSYLGQGQTGCPGIPYFPLRNVNGILIPSFISDDADADEPGKPSMDSPPLEEGSTAVAAGGVLSGHSSPSRRLPRGPNGIAFGDLMQPSVGRARSGTDQLPHALPSRTPRQSSLSRSPSPHNGPSRTMSVDISPTQPDLTPFTGGVKSPSRPVIANGTVLRLKPSPAQCHPPGRQKVGLEELALTLVDEPLQIFQVQGLGEQHTAAKSSFSSHESFTEPTPRPPASERAPVIVNGTYPLPHSYPHPQQHHHQHPQPHPQPHSRLLPLSHTHLAAIPTPPSDEAAFRARMQTCAWSPKPTATAVQSQPSVSQHNSITSLDLAGGDIRPNGPGPSMAELQSLSPVMEHHESSSRNARKQENIVPVREKAPAIVSSFGVYRAPTHATNGEDRRRKSDAQCIIAPHQRPIVSPIHSPIADGPRDGNSARVAKHISADISWQTATRRGKKSADIRIQPSGSGSGEQPPRVDAERKGG